MTKKISQLLAGSGDAGACHQLVGHLLQLGYKVANLISKGFCQKKHQHHTNKHQHRHQEQPPFPAWLQSKQPTYRERLVSKLNINTPQINIDINNQEKLVSKQNMIPGVRRVRRSNEDGATWGWQRVGSSENLENHQLSVLYHLLNIATALRTTDPNICWHPLPLKTKDPKICWHRLVHCCTRLSVGMMLDDQHKKPKIDTKII